MLGSISDPQGPDGNSRHYMNCRNFPERTKRRSEEGIPAQLPASGVAFIFQSSPSTRPSERGAV